ncbi:crossover junction endodeoxyribonuclease RuvC [bacterium]|nr:crossover junction endodeoxyribonuclease RuvC [bacterium]
MRILGIDPGSIHLGWGVIDYVGKKPVYVASGCFLPGRDEDEFNERLLSIHREVKERIDKFQPDLVAVEDSFYGENVKTAIKLGQVRGVIMLAAYEKNCKVIEIPTRKIKQSVTGKGGASKHQVAYMVGQILKLQINCPEDETDALACAISASRI